MARRQFGTEWSGDRVHGRPRRKLLALGFVVVVVVAGCVWRVCSALGIQNDDDDDGDGGGGGDDNEINNSNDNSNSASSPPFLSGRELVEADATAALASGQLDVQPDANDQRSPSSSAGALGHVVLLTRLAKQHNGEWPRNPPAPLVAIVGEPPRSFIEQQQQRRPSQPARLCSPNAMTDRAGRTSSELRAARSRPFQVSATRST